MTSQKIKLSPKELLTYENITKDFDLIKFEKETTKKMKIRYNNPDDEEKKIIVESLDDIISVRSRDLNIEQKSSQYIKLTFNIPKTLGIYTSNVIVKNLNKGEIEEILRFHIQVI